MDDGKTSISLDGSFSIAGRWFHIISWPLLLIYTKVLYISGEKQIMSVTTTTSNDPFPVQTMGYVVADGKSNWLEGLILICERVIVVYGFVK